MTITTNTADRKALAKAIAEELGTTARYLGLPSYGYQIGDFTVDHDGNIIGGISEHCRTSCGGTDTSTTSPPPIRKPSPKHSRTRKRLSIQKRSPSPAWTFRFRRGTLRWHS